MIKISQPITPIGLRINPNGIPNLMQSSVSTSFILHPKHYPTNPAKRAISNGLRLNIPINTNPKGM